ncbi:MAG: ferredoxin-type protein NapF [Rhodospirillaceae bacterium]|nr:MAG: ferredoxin-type protein NapF [Rhodospirillaceae bacterium]
MQVSLTRRSMFTGRPTARSAPPMRPPWALVEDAFLDACTLCDKCLSACDEGILHRGAGRYPEVNFKSGECTFCKACVDVCVDDALHIDADASEPKPWHMLAKIDDKCLSANAITCRVCGDRCDVRAIQFKLAVGGIADPIIDDALCTGCGACVAPCPTNSVTINSKTEERAA